MEKSKFFQQNDAAIYIAAMKPSTIKSLGSESWWNFQDLIQKLSQQALWEVGQGITENIKNSLMENKKVPLLIHEIICISVWRENVLPIVEKLSENHKTRSFLVYMVLYHECAAISLLEAVLYHHDVCRELGDCSVDLIDYCAASIISLITKPQTSENSTYFKRQASDITFGVSMKCITIVQYLLENLESLPLSAVTRVYKTHDFPMLLVELIETSPWEMKDGDEMLKYSDNQWHKASGCSGIGRPEAHAWLALHQILLFPELGKYYNLTEFARGRFMKLNSKMSDWLLGQLPPLHQLKQALSYLSTIQLPCNRQTLILEIIPEIRNLLLREGVHGWDAIAEEHADRLINCPAQLAADIAERICKNLSAIPTSSNICAYCNQPAKSRCSRCKIVWYCGRKCQVSHYPAHKPTCTNCNP